MKFLKKLFITLLAAVAVTGCKKLDLAPSDRFSELNFWTIEPNVYNALYNNYSLMYNANLYFYNEALSDNAFSSSGDYNVIASGNSNSNLAKFQNDWEDYYQTIKSCNLFLAHVDENTTMSTEVKDRLKAETRFIRAFAHFNLAKWYGNVPLIDRDITPEEAQTIAPSTKAQVMDFVIAELGAIAEVLPSKNELPPAENGRITSGAALALQARALLYQGNKMNEVVAVCEKLMNQQAVYGTYGLVGDYSALFSNPATNRTNDEAILSLQYVPGVRTWNEMWDFAPRSVGGRVSSMAPTQELVDDYLMANGKRIDEAGSGYNENTPYINRDPRLTATIVYDGYNWTGAVNKTIYIKPGTDPDGARLDEYNPASQSASPTGYYWRKYYDPTALPNFVSGLNLHLLRYAEVLLNYAEAKNSLGQMDATVWDKTIRELRKRAGFTDAGALNYPGNDGMTDIIRRERRVETAMEGLRTDDIYRWRIAEDVLNGWAHGAKFSSDPSTDNGYIRAQDRNFDPDKNYLWPIPARDLGLNPNLKQNPGY
ncbi:RagB/SusD family nutrient uptake outer membrane protein [Mucilaginibacter hurinus]|uniref:RagB/SusD family nutrient uptake outer membrane protein n=1 Tax=Mucilaginibacter hurinus TaxID=2201324 RepID=A0A367GKI0_9SPHI|nr:RagB/SusD family nutrient uptake outer membrane protein [Mucilaginibacter hurinus]RCH53987.1 RagB/SusD family nutrient uptake outer membrane protein [Mucilaginibacter hurinus]